MLQFINWLSFLHNSQLNFLVTVFCLVLFMVISKMIHNLKKSWMQTALQGTSISKGTQWLSLSSEPFNHKNNTRTLTLHYTSQIISFSSCNWVTMLQNKPHRKEMVRRYKLAYKFINQMALSGCPGSMAAATPKTVTFLGRAAILPVAIYCTDCVSDNCTLCFSDWERF